MKTLEFGRTTATLLYGRDCRDYLRGLPAASVHCVVTSPPYWGLRDYGTTGQIGLEPTPTAYVDQLVDVFAEVRRVLREDGTVWLNLGDTYARGRTGRADAGRLEADRGRWAEPMPRSMIDRPTPKGVKDKDLLGLPWQVAFALRDDGWYLRSDIVWHKVNPLPESVTDRPTKGHEYLFLLTRSPTYFYDHEAIKEPGRRGTRRNRRTVWAVAAHPYKGAHFATFPPPLVRPCILAGTSARGCCPHCGAPWRRVLERVTSSSGREKGKSGRKRRLGYNAAFSAYDDGSDTPSFETVGWEASCACGVDNDPIPCTVLDPFSGSATTGAVALALGRSYVGLDISPDYLELATQRLEGRKPSDPNPVPPSDQLGLFAPETSGEEPDQDTHDD